MSTSRRTPSGGEPQTEQLGRNLTKDRAPHEPGLSHPARNDQDDRVHLAVAAPVDLVDPSALRTLCGAAVFEVFNDGREPTCERCRAVDPQTGATR
ncbi:MAG: hypothetical protein ACT4O0_15425 [Pseudonocardia sp.]